MVIDLTDIDHHNHEALVAVPAGKSGIIVGVARFIRDPAHPDTAEVAVAVADSAAGTGRRGRPGAAGDPPAGGDAGDPGLLLSSRQDRPGYLNSSSMPAAFRQRLAGCFSEPTHCPGEWTTYALETLPDN
jgi:hypothetical protein